MSRSQQDKGSRIEREIVDRHKAIGVHAERFPLSGASRERKGKLERVAIWFRDNDHIASVAQTEDGWKELSPAKPQFLWTDHPPTACTSSSTVPKYYQK